MSQQAIAGSGATSIIAACVLVGALYVLGSFAMGRLYALAIGSVASRAVFYAFVAPGVMLHELAHALGCVATLTPIRGFAPFRPERREDGSLELGYVRHDRRASPVEALIGLAPVVINPVGLIVVTAVLLSFDPVYVFELPPLAAMEAVLNRATQQPIYGILWAYVAGSFALGSVPSRSDLSSLPAALAALVLAAFIVGAVTSVDIFAGVAGVLVTASALATKLYALPAIVAALAAALAWFVTRYGTPTK